MEKKQKTKKAIRPNSTADWAEVKRDYLKGLSQDEIVDKYSINKHTLNVHITGEGWTADRDKMLVKTNNKIIEREAEKRTDEILNLKIDERKTALLAQERVKDFLHEDLKPYELKLLVDCIQKIQSVLYKSYGIDEINFNVNSQNESSVLNVTFDYSKEAMLEYMEGLLKYGILKSDDILDGETKAEKLIEVKETPAFMIKPDTETEAEAELVKSELSNDPHLIPASLRRKFSA